MLPDDFYAQGLAAAGGALGAFIGQLLYTGPRMRKLFDQALARELAPIRIDLEALKAVQGWKQRAKEQPP
jgi:hypothetical protein